ncbi:hypothetical protein H7J06_24580 [Mycobacterium hodleri]|uniref:hypothetical protein n=1 Tax=Mycolicibacterium hodleri TaxID=49897 RepID=UPI000A56B8B2|nr:hypothetical protein [Mycolicibacterium hodleri]MCV7136153.1 hypothetical protein [Mycolicibacterium hodleri]
MSLWTILDASGRRASIEATDVTTRRDGSLLLLREDGNSMPVRLVPVFALSRGAWHSAWVDGAEVNWSSAESAPEPAPAPPRLLANVVSDEADVFAESRRAAVADRLAALPQTWEENHDR